jgi:hypothetical protein
MANRVRKNISLASVEYMLFVTQLIWSLHVSFQKRDMTVPETLNFINFSAVNVFMHDHADFSPEKVITLT